jgi:hypothetical protein
LVGLMVDLMAETWADVMVVLMVGMKVAQMER